MISLCFPLMPELLLFIFNQLILSKFLDCLTTQKYIRSTHMETNPIARKLMQWFGVKTAIWMVFLVAVGISALSYYVVLLEGTKSQYVFICIGLIISVIQYFVAWRNWRMGGIF